MSLLLQCEVNCLEEMGTSTKEMDPNIEEYPRQEMGLQNLSPLALEGCCGNHLVLDER